MKLGVNQESYLDRGGHPTIRELLQKLVFNPVDGTIKLNDRRLILQRTSYGGTLRDELLRAVGKEEASVILMRLGFKSGMEDAAFLRKAWPNLDLGDAFTAGTRLHTLRGMVRVETVYNDFDFRRSKFSGEFVWHDSAEACDYCERHGRSHDPVCWSQVGYASGYATHFFEKPILYKEVQCVARGDRACRVIGKPIDAWDDEQLVHLFKRRILPESPAPSLATGSRSAAEAPPTPQRSPTSLLLAPVKLRLDQIARANIPALITGEPGTGKRAAAHYLHEVSWPADAPFQRLHCTEVRQEELDEILSPKSRVPGRSRRLSDRPGTLVLDAIERLSEGAQLRLAELLEASGFIAEPVERTRLVAVTTLSPRALAARAGFRRDLLHRLSVLPVALPSLRERRRDIADLAAELLRSIAMRQNLEVRALSPEAIRLVCTMEFQGNMPELESLLTAALLTADGDAEITEATLNGLMSRETSFSIGGDQHDVLESDIEKAVLTGNISLDEVNNRIYQTTIRLADGNVSRAARMLGLSRAQFAYRLAQAGMSAD